MSGHPFQELFCSSCDTTTPGANGFLLGGFNNDLGPQGVNSVILGGKNMNVNVLVNLDHYFFKKESKLIVTQQLSAQDSGTRSPPTLATRLAASPK